MFPIGWWVVVANLVGLGSDVEPAPVAAFVLEGDAERFIEDDDSDGAYNYSMYQQEDE